MALGRPGILEWLGGHDRGVLVVCLVLVVAVWGFLEIADEVFEGSTRSIDERLLLALRREGDPSVPVGPDWLRETGRDVTALGGSFVLLSVTAAVAGYLLLAGRRHAMWLVLGATAGGVALDLLLKALFSRARPDVVPHLTRVSTTSFPSGHSMVSTVVYLTLGALLARFTEHRRLKFYFLLVALLAAFLVGVSRVYMGVHYPSDVAAGWSAGLAWALLCWLLARRLQRRGTVEPASPTSPRRSPSTR